MPTASFRLLVNGVPVEAAGATPQTMLLAWLRETRQLTGTKEGCAEGDCGACTVVLAEREGERLAWKPINACIRPLASVAGKAVFTVEALKGRDGVLHPVQQAMVDAHGSQCGFCTPGFVMSLFGLYKNASRPSRRDVDDALSGNLCRCTGYRPILEAAQRMYELPAPADWRGPGDVHDADRQLAEALASIAAERALDFEGEGQRWIAPDGEDALARTCADHPRARIVAGATDVGLWITKQHLELGTLISTLEARDLRNVERTATQFTIGAAASLADAFAALGEDYPELDEAWVRFASVPIRHSGTLGGNIANASPIGDSMPALIALGATLVLRHGDARRELPLEAFYLGYQKTARVPGEFLSHVRVPRRRDGLTLRAWKISKRFDQDISAVFACFALALDGDRVSAVRIGCGGVAPIPVRARVTEAMLLDQPWTEATAASAATTLAGEFTPIDDMRASAAYRRRVLGNLVLRLWHDAGAKSAAALRVGEVGVTTQ